MLRHAFDLAWDAIREGIKTEADDDVRDKLAQAILREAAERRGINDLADLAAAALRELGGA